MAPKRYGFSQSFINSGDLRFVMALGKIGDDRTALFEKMIQTDDLIKQDPKNPLRFTYNARALKQQAEFLATLSAVPPLFTARTRRPADLNDMYHKATVMLCGSAPSFDGNSVKTAQNAGVPVMTMGNAAMLVQNATMWVGTRGLPAYIPVPVDKHVTMAFLPEREHTAKMWDTRTSQRSPNYAVGDMPNTFFFDRRNLSVEGFLQTPAVADFGVPTTFTTALSICFGLGFTNVILNGVRLGGNRDEWYPEHFKETLHSETYQEKVKQYTKIKHAFPAWYKKLTSHGLRIVALESSPLDVPVFPKDFLEQAIGTLMPMSKGPVLTGLSVPHKTRKALQDKSDAHAKAAISTSDLLDNFEKVKAAYPQAFDIKKFVDIKAKIDGLVAKGKCAPCTKNKLGRPILDLFRKGVVEGDEVMHQLWADIFPDKYTIHDNSGLVFRKDKAHLQQEAT